MLAIVLVVAGYIAFGLYVRHEKKKRGAKIMAEYSEHEAVFAEIENLYKDAQKIKTSFAKIIVDGTVEKPYYSILWMDKESKEYNIGYSSYCLDYVFKWLEVVFELVAADEPPAVDAVEVTRCKDCKHGEIDDPDFPDQYYCRSGCGWNKGDFYCAYGERREDDG